MKKTTEMQADDYKKYIVDMLSHIQKVTALKAIYELTQKHFIK